MYNKSRFVIWVMLCISCITASTSAQVPLGCDTGLESRFIPATIGEVIAVDGLTLHAQPTLDSQVIATLTEGDTFTAWYGWTCRDEAVWWFVEKDWIMGWLTESLHINDDYFIAPLELPDTDFFRPRAGDEPRLIEQKQMQFLLSANVGANAEVRWVLANPDALNPQIYAHPTHRLVIFEGLRGSVQNPSLIRHLRVHPAEEWKHVTGISLDDLRLQLDERPDDPYLTGLQAVGAARFLNADPTYVDFQNGSGIRALIQYSQSGAPVVDGELLYQFVGMTDDREYLIHAAFALDSTLIPSDAKRDEAFNFDAYIEYELVSDDAFMPTVADVLSDAPDETFMPRLSDLDNFIASLRVNPHEWCGETPSLLSVGDTVRQSLDNVPLRVRDSANGTMIDSFLPDEEAVIIGGSACIDGIVWWEVFRVNEWRGWVAELSDDSYYLEKVNNS